MCRLVSNRCSPRARAFVHLGLRMLAMVILFASVVDAQEPPVEIPPVDRKPYATNGFLELRLIMIWQDTDAALLRLRSLTDERPDAHPMQLNSRIQLDASYRRRWFTAQTRGVVDTAYISGDWSAEPRRTNSFCR